jgi:hypothetical protein
MLFWLRVFLHDTGLIRPEDTALIDQSLEAQLSENCNNCARKLQADYRYCPYCGDPRLLNCESCRRGPLQVEWRLCPYCEEPVARYGKHNSKEKKRARQEFKVLCKGAYLDGVVNAREHVLLEAKRLELQLTEDEAEEIESFCAPKNVMEYQHLVESSLLDGEINPMERAFLKRKAEQLKISDWIANQIENTVVELHKYKTSPFSYELG